MKAGLVIKCYTIEDVSGHDPVYNKSLLKYSELKIKTKQYNSFTTILSKGTFYCGYYLWNPNNQNTHCLSVKSYQQSAA